MRGVILYGPPASGKSTITAVLEESGEFALFKRLKVGQGNTTGYRMTTPEHLDQLRSTGEILWENHRYGATYAVDRHALDQALAASLIPILHLGQPEGIEAIADAYPAHMWLVVELWADLIDTEIRLQQRGTIDVAVRLDVWSQTPPLAAPDLWIDTTQEDPHTAAARIQALVL